MYVFSFLDPGIRLQGPSYNRVMALARHLVSCRCMDVLSKAQVASSTTWVTSFCRNINHTWAVIPSAGRRPLLCQAQKVWSGSYIGFHRNGCNPKSSSLRARNVILVSGRRTVSLTWPSKPKIRSGYIRRLKASMVLSRLHPVFHLSAEQDNIKIFSSYFTLNKYKRCE